MAEQSTFSNPAQLIQSFNEIQNNMGDAFTQGRSISQAKQVAGNMLLTMGVPFFAERLGKHIGVDAVKSIKQFANGELGLKDALSMAKDKFDTDILPQAKKALFEEAGKYIPGLDNVDLSKATASDIKNLFQQKITQKLKSALPDDIAQNLPESFSQEDIINSVKQLGADQALKYAKDTLPPDVYSQLESNQDLIRDPAKIAGFINSNIEKTKNSITNLAKQTQEGITTKLAETKQALLDKAEEQLGPIRDKISSIGNLREAARQEFANARKTLQTQYDNVSDRLDDFTSRNPMATEDDLAPFKNKLAELKQSGQELKTNFLESDRDLGSQLDDAKQLLQNNTELLYSKINDLKTGLFRRATQVASQAQEAGQQALEQATTEGQRIASRAIQTGQRTVSSLRAAEGEGRAVLQEGEGLLDKFKSWGTKKWTAVKQAVSREPARPTLLNPEETLGPRGMDVGFPMRQELMQRRQLIQTNQDPEDQQRQLLDEYAESELPPPPAAQAPAAQAPAEQAPAAQLSEIEPAPPLSEQAPSITQSRPTQALSEPLDNELPAASISETEIASTQAEKGVAGLATKVAAGLDEAAAATEEVPVLDIIMDTAGLLGSIFGGKALLGGGKPAGPPEVSGGSYEPNL
jgi:vacuolar-type H+-ATPase subunit H